MNKTTHLLALFTFLTFLASCSPSQQASYNDRQNGSSGNTNNPASPVDSLGDPIINLPSTNEVAPAGILDQLAWTERGGGDASTPTPAPIPICSDCNIRMQNSQVVLLTNFAPNQKIRIVFYKHSTERSSCGFPSANYLTNSEVQVDEQGNLSIQLNGADMNVFVAVAFDANTGPKVWELSGRYGYEDCNVSVPSGSSCPGAPPQRLQVNKMAYVCTQSDSVKLRSDAGKQYSEIKSLVPGADLTIIGGPICADNWSWWQVKTESGFIGWMSEGGDEVDEYFLCPK